MSGRSFFLPTLALTLLLAPLAPPPVEAQPANYETTRIADGVYQFRAATHNTLFVVGESGVLAFDPISTEAATRYAEAIRERAPDLPLRWIVYSHHHADHATGAGVLREAKEAPEALVVAHRRAGIRLEAIGDPDLPPPDLTFTERMALDLGDRAVELHYLGPSHGDDLIVGFLPGERIAFAVDFVMNDTPGFRTLGAHVFPDFFETLPRLLGLDFETIVFGHGPPGDRRTVERQVAYYRDLRAAVAEAVDRGWSEDRAAEEVRLPRYGDWAQYDEWFPLNVRGVYRWMAESGQR